MRERRIQNSQAGFVQIIRLRIEEIYIGRRTVKDDPGIVLLAASIKKHGMLQPVVVRADREAGRYVLISGARRLRACRLAGIESVDAAVLDCSVQEGAACYLEEHLTRESPGAMEEAKLLCLAGGMDIAPWCALPEKAVAERLALLGLPEAVRSEIDHSGLLFEQVQPLLSVSDAFRQMEAVSIIAQRELSSAQVRRLVFGPERCRLRSGKRRAAALVTELINRAVEGIRAHGVPVQVNMCTHEGGISIQITAKIEAVTRKEAGNAPTGANYSEVEMEKRAVHRRTERMKNDV